MASRKTSVVASTSDSSDSQVDFSVLPKYLPPDAAIQTEILAKAIAYYAKSGNLSRIKGFNDEHKLLLDSWRRPDVQAIDKQVYHVYFQNINLNWNLAWYTDVLNAGNTANGTCFQISNLLTANDPQIWQRQSQVVKFEKMYVDMILEPTIAQTGLDPTAVTLNQKEINVQVIVFVDTFAFLSNKTNGSGIGINLVQGGAQQQAGTDPGSIFYTADSTALASNLNHRLLLMDKNEAGAGRFHILHRQTHNLDPSMWASPGTSSLMYQMPGRTKHLEFEVPLDVVCPYQGATAVEPYLNSIYFLVMTDRGSVGFNYSVTGSYALKVFFKDVGQIAD